jgi:hypothetical protein
MFQARRFGRDNQQTNDNIPLPTVQQVKKQVYRIAYMAFVYMWAMGFDRL